MMIERTLYDEDHKLREERYRATVGEVINRPNFGDGIEGQVTTKNELKFTKDRDSIVL
jgi:hypothetical protein